MARSLAERRLHCLQRSLQNCLQRSLHHGLPWLLLSALGGGCALLDPACQQARSAHQRQLLLAENASSGGVDAEALRRSQARQRQACGLPW